MYVKLILAVMLLCIFLLVYYRKGKKGKKTNQIMSVIPQTGSQCLDLATRAVECLQSDPEVAQQYLEVIKQSTPTLLEKFEERVTALETKRDELQHQDASLSREIGAKEEAKQQLQREINNLEAKKVRDEASLEDARRQLCEAEIKRNDAQERKEGAVGGTVATSVGAVVLGVFFPPTLLVTAPAVAAIGTISIKEASDAVDRYRARVSGRQRDIEEEKSKIQEANKGISGIESEISDLTSKQATLHANRGHLRTEIVFLQKAVTLLVTCTSQLKEASKAPIYSTK